MSDFASAVNAVLKYSATEGDVAALLHEIAVNPEHQHTPDSVHRLVTADALDEVGREREAKYLRQRRPVAIRDGVVIPQRYTRNHVSEARRPLYDVINRATDWGFDHGTIPNSTWLHDAPGGSSMPSKDDMRTHHFHSQGHKHGMLQGFTSEGEGRDRVDTDVGEPFHVTKYPDWLANQYEKALQSHRDRMSPDDREVIREHLDRVRMAPVTEDERDHLESEDY